MRTHLKLEQIGKRRPWVARINGLDEEGRFVRDFIKPLKDYANANSVGSRGIYHNYLLDSGLFEIYSPRTWNRDDRYFALIENGQLREMSMIEAMPLLTSLSDQRADRFISK
jgi:hypothetical protein